MTATKQMEKKAMADNQETVTRVLDPVNISEVLAKDYAHLADEFKEAEVVTKDGRMISLVGKNVRADVLIAGTKADGKAYEAEYVSVSARTLEGAAAIMKGVTDETVEGEGDEAREKPSLVKYFNQGFGILARNACASRIRLKLEGPDKALMASAKALARARGWNGDEGIAKALAKIKALQNDD